jgi:DNA-binding FadR family transcriptional regulator
VSQRAAKIEDNRANPAALRPAGGVGAISAHLRRAIETGAYAEGDQLPPERQLATSFGAARSTVRRALDQLERAGLVSRRLGSGTYVLATGAAPPGFEVADEISPLQLIEARFAVEPFTTRLAVLNATRRNLEDMGAALRRAEAAPPADKDLFSKCDSQFHLEIARASRNPLLLAVYRQINEVRLHAQWDAMKQQILTPGVIAEYNRQHREILNAFEKRDAQLAETVVKTHLEKARNDLLRAHSR